MRTLAGSLCVLVYLLVMTTVWAADEPPASPDAVDIDLGEIEVEAERIERPAVDETEQLPPAKTTSTDPGTTVIELNALHGANDIPRILQQAPGTAVLRSGGAGQLATAQLRGARGNQVTVTLDGMPFPSFGTVDLSLLPMADVGNIAVQRGARAGGGVGGAIDLRTARQPADATSQLVNEHVSMTAGGHGLLRAQWSRYGPNSQWHYSHLQAENDYSFERSGGGSAKRLNNGAQLEQLWSSWDTGSIRWNAGVSHLERGVPGSAEFPTVQARLQETAGWVTGRTEDALFGATWIQSAFHDPQPYLHAGPLKSSDQRWHSEYTSGSLADSTSEGWGWRLRGDLADGSSSGDAARSRAGGDLLHSWVEEDRAHQRRTIAELGMVASSDVGFSPTASVSTERQLGKRWQGYASAGYSVRHPDFSELYYTDTGGVRGNPDLNPERMLSAEVGLRTAGFNPPAEGGLKAAVQSSFECAAFWNRYEDSILFLPVSSYLVQATNTGPATIAGMEGAWRVPLSGALTSATAVTWLPIAEMDEGTPLPQRAPLRINSRLDWRRRDWSAYAAADYAARMPADLHGNLRIPSRVLFDFGLAHDIHEGELGVAVTNVLDENSRDSWNYPLPGREISLSWRTTL